MTEQVGGGAGRRIMVAVPAYNCAAQVPRVIRQFTAETGPLFAEVVVIDNQSRDDTIAAALSAAQENPHVAVTVMRNVDNYSLGGTHKSPSPAASRRAGTGW
jgi:Glycosyltransferases involved in cell wall biogenesis